jgi:predicted nucleic acid-binding protein
MPEEKRRNEQGEVRIYIDTCILQGAISRRNEKDTIFMNKIKEKRWKAFTSIHTLLELLDMAKDRSFLMKSVINRWVDVNTFLRERRTKQLSSDDMDEISDELNNFFKSHDFIGFMSIDNEVWNDVKDIAEKSNLHSSDALHLALARMWDCQILVTHDQFFIKEGNKLLKEAGISGNIQICDVDKVEETLDKILAK